MYTSIMGALKQFEATEANVGKLEQLWETISGMVPAGVSFGQDHEYEDRVRSYALLLQELPMIDGWKPSAELPDLDVIAHSRFDAMDLGEISAQASVERWIDEPGRELREYRFKLDNKRRALIRDALVSLIDEVDGVLRKARELDQFAHGAGKADAAILEELRNRVKQIEVLLGSSVGKPNRWSDLSRHLHYGEYGDLRDIVSVDWPAVKDGLRKGLYGAHDPVPVEVQDLGSLVASRPTGPVATGLSWNRLSDESFERLIFEMIATASGYENAEWLMKTRAPDRGRDLSVNRVIRDELAGTARLRVVIQCKHWLSRSVGLSDVATAKDQAALWDKPPVAVLVVATSGRFTTDAVSWVEAHNLKGVAPSIEMWPDSKLERILAARPGLIAEFGLRD